MMLLRRTPPFSLAWVSSVACPQGGSTGSSWIVVRSVRKIALFLLGSYGG